MMADSQLTSQQDSVWLYGVGGHALVVTDVLKDLGVEVAGFFDDDQALVDANPERVHPGIGLVGAESFQRPSAPMIVSVGNCEIRRKLAGQLGGSFVSAIHPTATVSDSAQIGEGSVVFHQAVVQAETQLGKHVIVNTGAKVDHENVLGDFVHVAPGSVLCGNVTIGEGTLVGAGAVVIPGVQVGSHCTLGAGAVVIRDVRDYAVVVGNPGRVINCVGSE